MSAGDKTAFQYVLSPIVGRGWIPQGTLANSGDNQPADATLPGIPAIAFNYVFDGVNWDRQRSLVDSADTVAATTIGLAGSVVRLTGFNGATYDRLRSFAGNADNVASPALGLLGSASFSFAYDGTTWDRRHSQSAANASASPQVGVALSAPPGNWSITHTPAANTQATISRAAVAATRHICTSISARLIADAASVSGTVQVNLRDGATGAGTILWSETLKVGGAASVTAENAEIKLSGLQIPGSVNTAMTLEFSAAGGANTVESVAMTGYDVT